MPTGGLTLPEYANAKRLPLNFLRGELRLGDFVYLGQPAVPIPYLDTTGTEVAVQFRLAMDGPDRFRWRRGDKACPYGLWLLKKALAAGYVVIVEGPSDVHTLLYHSVSVLGIPSTTGWREEWAQLLAGIPTIYIVVEPDRGGEAVGEWLRTSSYIGRIGLRLIVGGVAGRRDHRRAAEVTRQAGNPVRG